MPLRTRYPRETKKTIEDACDATLRWIESNAGASKEEFDAERKKLEGICMPIMAKLGGGGGGMPDMGGDMPDMSGFGGPSSRGPGGAGGAGPTVEEFDVD